MTLNEIAPLIGLDTGRMAAMFGGNEGMYLKYLRKFPAHARPLLDGLAAAVAGNDHGAIAQTAHDLKGIAANLGLRPVAEAAAALMLDVRGGLADDVGREKIKEHFDQLAAAAGPALEYIERL